MKKTILTISAVILFGLFATQTTVAQKTEKNEVKKEQCDKTKSANKITNKNSQCPKAKTCCDKSKAKTDCTKKTEPKK